MKKTTILVLSFLLNFSFVGSISAQNEHIPSVDLPELGNLLEKTHINVCGLPTVENARCQARVVTDDKGKPLATTGPAGLTPSQFHTGYNLPVLAPSQQIIAIVDAYDDPTAKNDLDVYSSQFGLGFLPPCSGPVAASLVPCFSKVNQNGSQAYPAVNSGWALEISLDLQVARAICQNCSLLLVEANSSSFGDLMKAFDQAVAQGARIISNSYGSAGEFYGELAYDSHFAGKLGYAITFSSGDSGYGTSYPAASKYVTSVGGTTLNLDTLGNYVSESAWSGSGSGCSLLETKPSFQTDSSCSRRMIADVSADANPATGAAVYNSTPYQGQSGWFQVGGTSLSAPLIAGVYALAGGVPTNMMGNQVPYTLKNYLTNLHDVKSGANGNCRKNSAYFCQAVTGYDGPTGLGTPNGTNSF